MRATVAEVLYPATSGTSSTRPPVLNKLPANHLAACVVFTLDQHLRANQLDLFEGRLFVEDNYGVDTPQFLEDYLPGRLIHDGALFALAEGINRAVAV